MFRLHGHTMRLLFVIAFIFYTLAGLSHHSSTSQIIPSKIDDDVSGETNLASVSSLIYPNSKDVPRLYTKKLTSLSSTTTTTLNYNLLPEPGLSFYNIRNEERIFVDKTKYLEYLLDRKAIFYFVTRPRRFGKTVFLQMMMSFFKGEKQNFKNLTIYKHGKDQWVEYPVIYLDFNALGYVDTMKDFRNKLIAELLKIAKEHYGLKYTKKDFLLKHMVNDLNKKFHGRGVVILMDEYDLHIRDALKSKDQNLARAIQKYLTFFFAEIKSCVFDLKLVFVSGISRLSIDGLTHGGYVFVDLTNDANFAAAVGLTRSEINNDAFRPFINELGSCERLMMDKNQCKNGLTKEQCTALFLNETGCENGLTEKECNDWVKGNRKELWRRLDRWYDGYTYVPQQEKLLNPFSVFECLRRRRLGSYWKHDDSVNHLAREMSRRNLPWDYYVKYRTTGKVLYSRFDIEDDIPLPLELLMNGLLTIKSYDSKDDELVLDFPNDDIRDAVREKVLLTRGGDEGENLKVQHIINEDLHLFYSFENGTMDKVVEIINDDFLDENVVEPQKMEESHLTTMLLNYFKTKRVSCKGSILMKDGKKTEGDLDMQTTGLRINYIIEVKCTQDGDWDAVEKFVKYSKAKTFRNAIAHQDKVFLLGLNFRRVDTGQYKIVNWVRVLYEYSALKSSCLNFEQLDASNPKIITRVNENKETWLTEN